MNIALITGVMTNGGAERVVSVLANYLILHGHKPFIFSIAGGPCGYALNHGVQYVPNDTTHLYGIERIMQRTGFLGSKMEEFQIEIALSFCTEANIYAIAASKKVGIPVVVSERNDPYRDPPSVVKRKLRDLIYPFADGYVFQTPKAKGYFSCAIQAKSTLLPNPINQNIPDPYFGPRKKNVVAVARLEPQKNIELLLKAFAVFAQSQQNYTLEIFGKGSLEETLRDVSMSLKIDDRVFFHGFSPSVFDKIKDAGMFVLSSNYEGLPNALLEAMALGLPSISTNCPVGAPEMLIKNSENGLLVEVDNVNELAEAMSSLAANDDYAAELGRKASSVRYLYAPDEVCPQWVDYLQDVLDDEKRVPRHG